MPKITPIEQVPESFSKEKIVVVCNPLEVDFECGFAGKPIVLKAGEMKQMVETMAAHVAKHLAIKILNDGLVGFLLEHFEGLTEQGREKWRVQGNVTFTRAEVIDLAKTLINYDYQIGDEKPEMPEVKTKFNKKDGKGKPVEDKPLEEEKGTVPSDGTGKESADEDEVDEDEEEEDESVAAPKEKKAGKSKK